MRKWQHLDLLVAAAGICLAELQQNVGMDIAQLLRYGSMTLLSKL